MKRDSKCSFHVHWEKQEEKIPLNIYSDLRHNYKNLLISREGKHRKKLSMDIVESPLQKVFRFQEAVAVLLCCQTKSRQNLSVSSQVAWRHLVTAA